MALSVEAAEPLKIFQWLTEGESRRVTDEQRRAIEQEVTDIQICLAHIADVVGIDIPSAVDAKLAVNRAEYPAKKVRGRSDKYDR